MSKVTANATDWVSGHFAFKNVIGRNLPVLNLAKLAAIIKAQEAGIEKARHEAGALQKPTESSTKRRSMDWIGLMNPPPLRSVCIESAGIFSLKILHPLKYVAESWDAFVG